MNIFAQSLSIARSPIICCVALMLAIFPTVVSADAISAHMDGIYVEDATITPTQKGEAATLRFRVTNFRGRQVTLIGVKALFAKSGKMVMLMPEKGPVNVSSLGILSEETLDFTTPHLKGELRDVAFDLVLGTNIEFELTFSDFTTTATAHVH